MGAATPLLCESHIERAGVRVAAEHVVEGKGFCAHCFRGEHPLALSPIKPADQQRGRRRRFPRRELLQPTVAAANRIRRRLNRIEKAFAASSRSAYLARVSKPARETPSGILSKRQQLQIRDLAGQGLLNRESARDLGVLAPTIKFHLPLSKRQRQVCDLAKQGLLNREIARELGLSVPTVKLHLRCIYQKANLDSAARHVSRYKLIAGLQRIPGDEQSAAG